jgi:serine/threonine protein kinase
VTQSTLLPTDFTKLQLLGEGQFATVRPVFALQLILQVHVVQCRLDGHLYAMKAMMKHKAARYSKVKPRAPKRLTNQALQLPAERYLHIQGRGAAGQSVPVPALFAAFQTADTLYLVMELAALGSLADRVESQPDGLDEAEIRWWSTQLVDAIAWVHTQGFAHR